MERLKRFWCLSALEKLDELLGLILVNSQPNKSISNVLKDLVETFQQELES